MVYGPLLPESDWKKASGGVVVTRWMPAEARLSSSVKERNRLETTARKRLSCGPALTFVASGPCW